MLCAPWVAAETADKVVVELVISWPGDDLSSGLSKDGTSVSSASR